MYRKTTDYPIPNSKRRPDRFLHPSAIIFRMRRFISIMILRYVCREDVKSLLHRFGRTYTTTGPMSSANDSSRIRTAVEQAEAFFQKQTGPQPDTPATATIESGLRCRVESPDGRAIYTDMPEGIGGTATANSPGWHFRAALASCDASLLAIRAARVGVQLDSIQVKVDGESDGRGMLLDEGISAGSSKICIVFKVSSKTATKKEIEDLIHWVEEHSPVGTDVSRAVNVNSEIEISESSDSK